ncbi:ABC-2 transporter permease [Lederbergia wuyishanensis]|uniref:ABC-2 type transporter domain-containing protein n=1 Tax=Lederbergia wuyishanensis TaxID=1347903 RepID=A0ABU0D7F9_9BACI|nr:ABC-2 transporter permease [Lederbergia wuyishanensis]MCJ8009025.1 ABC-2 transporter permease [Lederbergia wuyishanensis]MDQ0344357.1 hypothetical protein [Lederbergia wuyishanensis]
MINLIKTDIKSIKLLEYIIMIPFVFILAFLVNPGFEYPYYIWIFYFTFGICSSSLDQKRNDNVQPVIISLPISRKNYIGAKYLLPLVWFFLSTIGATIIALLFNWRTDFFEVNLLITSFLLIILLMAIYLPLCLFYRHASFFVPFILIFVLTMLNTTNEIHFIQFHPILLLSIILFYLSYLLSVKIFDRKII